MIDGAAFAAGTRTADVCASQDAEGLDIPRGRVAGREGLSPHLLAFSLAGVATLIAVVPASASDTLCPDVVKVQQTGAAPAPEWTVSYSTLPNRIEMVTFYSGPPQDRASLVYDDWVNANDASHATWKFPKDPRGYWVECAYRGTTLQLSKALPPTVSSCRVTYDRQAASAAGLPSIKSVACQ